MKSASNKFAVAVGIFVVGTLLSGKSFGAWGNYSNSKVVPQSWNGQSALFLPISASSSDDPITGMRHVTFTAKGNEAGPPDGAPIDNAIGRLACRWNRNYELQPTRARWEFVPGPVEKTGRSTYVLNHMPRQGDDTENSPGGIGNSQGGAQIVEKITLSPDRELQARCVRSRGQ